MGFFDGSCQGHPQDCGARALLYLRKSHFVSIKYGARTGTNNRAELYALWILLKVTQDQHVKNLQVLGDSKMLIEWENGRNQITNLELMLIMDEVR